MRNRLYLSSIIIVALFLYTQNAAAATTTTTAVVKPSVLTDGDRDGLSDVLEAELGTNPHNPDTDRDGYSDGVEVANGYNPLQGDKDRSMPRHVEVDLTTQQLSYYMGNAKIGTMPVSTGVLGMVTPTGTFPIFKKLPVHEYIGPPHPLGVGRRVERIAGDGDATLGYARERCRTCEHSDRVAAADQGLGEGAAHVPGAAGDEDFAFHSGHVRQKRRAVHPSTCADRSAYHVCCRRSWIHIPVSR